MSTAVAIIALPAASAVIWALLRSPLAGRIVNVPTGDRWSAAPTPSLGGIGIFAGFTIGLWAAVAVGAFHPGKEFLGVFTAIALVFAAGLADDLYGMPPLGKLATQLVAAAIVIGTGHARPARAQRGARRRDRGDLAGRADERVQPARQHGRARRDARCDRVRLLRDRRGDDPPERRHARVRARRRVRVRRLPPVQPPARGPRSSSWATPEARCSGSRSPRSGSPRAGASPARPSRRSCCRS